jgi:hypothetical protein
MFFKKKKMKEEENPIVEGKKNEYPQVVQEIHNEFMTAGDKALEEARAVLKECEGKDQVKGERLNKLGFKQTAQAKNAVESKEKKKVSEELARVISEYAFKYPTVKFITEAQVEEICKKYGLVCGNVSRYTGFVPEKNLNDIEEFLDTYALPDLWQIGDTIIDMSNYEIRESKDSKYAHWYRKDGTQKKHAFQANREDNFETFYADGIIDGKYYDLTSGFPGRLEKASMQICAPLKDMDTRGMRQVGHKLVREIPDPVVLQPVKHGYLIVTAWGDEASDPNVVNEKLN